MYWLPSRSVRRQPSASFTNTGVPPTPLNARTGGLTPPGITCWALRNADSELAMERWAGSVMGIAGIDDRGAILEPLNHFARVAAGLRRLSIWHSPGKPWHDSADANCRKLLRIRR